MHHKPELTVKGESNCEIFQKNRLLIILKCSDPVDVAAYMYEIGGVFTSIGEETRMRCLTGGYQNPTVGWWRDGKRLPSKDERFEITENNALIIYEVEKSDLGIYMCRASNAVGVVTELPATLKLRET